MSPGPVPPAHARPRARAGPPGRPDLLEGGRGTKWLWISVERRQDAYRPNVRMITPVMQGAHEAFTQGDDRACARKGGWATPVAIDVDVLKYGEKYAAASGASRRGRRGGGDGGRILTGPLRVAHAARERRQLPWLPVASNGGDCAKVVGLAPGGFYAVGC